MINTTDSTKLYVTNTDVSTFKSPKQYNWKPKKDITTYELALCLPFLFGYVARIENLPDSAKRHFEEIN